MRLIMVGCEYAGKTTLADALCEWAERTLGGRFKFHDHFTIPNPELGPEAAKEFLTLHPQIKEQYQRFIMSHHLESSFYANHDHNMVGFHIEEAVYAPLYYGYGGKDSGAPMRSPEGQRSYWARFIEKQLLEIDPETTLILVHASPEVIARRMKESPHEYQVVEEGDIEHVLERFKEEFLGSLIWRRVSIDTSTRTVEESLAELLQRIEPYLTDADRQRILSHRVLKEHFLGGDLEIDMHDSLV